MRSVSIRRWTIWYTPVSFSPPSHHSGHVHVGVGQQRGDGRFLPRVRLSLQQPLHHRERYRCLLPFTVAGDCRAVLGRRSIAEEGKLEAVQLTNDHNVREPAELKKLKEAHPSRRRSCMRGRRA